METEDEVTCTVCGKAFRGERFDDVRMDVLEHLEGHDEGDRR